ncbi:MAG TPA: LCP family protein [Solirubrobacteraceae bacterium]|jgi:LCP family protein required for cell wall assembly|nr:LCP family protein [Solirubrobacteraceae bacterium]
MTKRFILAAVGIVLLSGGATAAIALNEVSKVIDAFRQSKPVKLAPKLLTPAGKGAPQTLLLVGNDERPPPKDNPSGRVLPHSNEMLLVRIDPSKPTISMLSIPRELQVTFTAPNGEVITNRINSAYTYGGAQLMVETIKRLFGLTINHVFVTSFPKFRRAVDELGCVYMGVDRRYYHVNEPGGEQYFEINLQPGYQRMCGKQALEFVANRHEDTSLTRDARDQRFLLEVKAQYGASLFESREKFERILGRTVETDDTLRGQEQVLNLLELLVESQGKPVRQVPFDVTLLKTYDTASERQIHEAVESFLHGTAPIRRPTLSSAAHPSSTHRPPHHGAPPAISLTPTTSAELDAARSQAPNLPFPLEYPRARDSFGGAEPDTLRRYDVRDQQNRLHPIYVVAIDRGELGQFYDVQGTDWTDPPLLSNPSQTIQVGSRSYELFYAGEQIRVIAWHEAGAVYWIENTLTENVSPKAMLAMAEQTQPVIHGVGAALPTPTVRNVNLPARTTAAVSETAKIGALLGFVGIVVVALLSLLVLARQRELNGLRDQVAFALAVEARQRPLAAAGIADAQPQKSGVADARPAPLNVPDAQPAPTVPTVHRPD